MRELIIAISVENTKLWRAKVALISFLVMSLVPFAGGFFMFVLQDPALASKLGLISAKAQFVGVADWPSYFNFLAQALSVGGLLIFAFILSWIFGREYVDGTIKDLLALPISRGVIVVAKFSAAFFLSLMLVAHVLVLGLLAGKLLNLSGWSWAIGGEGALALGASALLAFLVSTPVAFLASLRRGYLAPLGFAVFTLVLAQLVAAIGYARLFPWSIPILASGLIPNAGGPGTTGVLLVFATAALGIAATIFWWRYADQH